MLKEKSIKNYIILVVIFLIGMGITLYLCKWYNVSNEIKRQIPVIRGSLFEISYEELDHFILENPSTTIYMCSASNDTCRNYETQLKKFISNKDLTEEIIYLNLSLVDDQSFLDNFNTKYPYKIKLSNNYPAFVTFEDGKVKNILQGTDNNLTISKTKQYFELNHIGE